MPEKEEQKRRSIQTWQLIEIDSTVVASNAWESLT